MVTAVVNGMQSQQLDSNRRPRILCVVLHIPYVPSTGGMTRVFHLVRAATGVADVTLVGAAESSASANLDMMRPLCERIVLIPPPSRHRVFEPWPRSAPAPVRHARDIVRALRRVNPYMHGRYDQAAIRASVGDLLRREDYDLVLVDSNELGEILRQDITAWRGPSVVILHNVQWMQQFRGLCARGQEMQQQRMREQAGGSRYALLRTVKRSLQRWSGWHLMMTLRTAEQALLRTYTRVVAVSEVDAAQLESLVPGTQVNIVPNGVDVRYFGEATPGPSGAHSRSHDTLVFTGTLGYPPNVDAMRFFVAEIWPLIRARRPATRFWIVGAAPSVEVQALAQHPGIEVYASVPDVRPYLADSAVAVVPLRSGSGTRLKILEALAAGRPVVSTTLGAEGLHLKPGRDLLLADTPAEFANAVVTLLERRGYAQEMAAHGQETVRHLYDWDLIGATFQRMLREIAARSTATVGWQPRALIHQLHRATAFARR